MEPATTDQPAFMPPLRGWRALLRDLFRMIRFYSRIPAPKLPFETDAHAPPDFTVAPRMLPLAGLVIGLPGAFVLWLGLTLGLPEMVAAVLAAAIAVFASGAFHEDGLADTFDGLGGGWTPERRLEIMKDSRIGSYGASALLLALAARVASLAALAEEAGAAAAVAAILAAAALSRPIGLMPLALLEPARAEGVSSQVGRPSGFVFALALGGGAGLAVALALAAGLGAAGVVAGLSLGVALAGATTLWARRAIGGQTGDVAGACQQFAEIALYLGLLMYL